VRARADGAAGQPPLRGGVRSDVNGVTSGARGTVVPAREPDAPRALYVHVPFCARRCSYCDFAVEAVRRPPTREWLDAIEAELRLRVAREGLGRLSLATVYVGGGTPSLLGVGALPALLDRIGTYADIAPGAEITAEANPESFTVALARDWRAAGINRVSLGAQTFHEGALRWMGRLHGADGPARAVAAAREAGFDNVSVDLIFGLPDRLGRDWGADLDRALGLEPEHVSLYGLTAEPGAPLGRWVAEGRERLPDEDTYAAQYLLAAERLTAAGFRHYEVSNFARPGRESRHNQVYWSGAPYLGLGPGAHSYLAGRRWWNVRSWAAYAAALGRGEVPEAGAETVEGAAARLERTWLALRTDQGFPLVAASQRQRRLAAQWAEQGWAVVIGDVLRLTPSGWLLLDRLAVELDDAA
jgi:oxygen-independent coproporphyrinogen-3 oxidase